MTRRPKAIVMTSQETYPKRRAGVLTRLAGVFTRLRGSRSGSTAVEFAIILPLFIVIVMGLMEFGRLFWVQVSLRHAVEQTARNAMAEYTRESFIKDSGTFTSWFTNTWEPSLEAAAPSEAYGFNASGVVYDATPTTESGIDYVLIEASYSFDFIFPVIPGVSTQTLTARSKTPLVGQR